MNLQFWHFIGWTVSASILGFAMSAIFAGRMRLSRNHFLVPYVALVGVFLYAFIVVNNIDVATLLIQNWVWGLLMGLLTSLILIRHVRTQPVSRQTYGTELLFDLTWAGLVYGIVDALFLNVMPVVASWIGASQFEWTATLIGKIGVGVLGLMASLLVTLAYHVGYPEFRNRRVGQVLVGNGVMTLAFLLSGNPLGSLISHPAMHIAAVLHGAETTIQLPPHYKASLKLN